MFSGLPCKTPPKHGWCLFPAKALVIATRATWSATQASRICKTAGEDETELAEADVAELQQPVEEFDGHRPVARRCSTTLTLPARASSAASRDASQMEALRTWPTTST